MEIKKVERLERIHKGECILETSSGVYYYSCPIARTRSEMQPCPAEAIIRIADSLDKVLCPDATEENPLSWYSGDVTYWVACGGVLEVKQRGLTLPHLSGWALTKKVAFQRGLKNGFEAEPLPGRINLYQWDNPAGIKTSYQDGYLLVPREIIQEDELDEEVLLGTVSGDALIVQDLFDLDFYRIYLWEE